MLSPLDNGGVIRQLHLIATRPAERNLTAWPVCPLCHQSTATHECDPDATYRALKEQMA